MHICMCYKGDLLDWEEAGQPTKGHLHTGEAERQAPNPENDTSHECYTRAESLEKFLDNCRHGVCFRVEDALV